MQFNEVSSSSILPGKKEEINITVDNINNYFLEKISKNSLSLYNTFNNASVTTPSILKSLLINLEYFIKSKSIEDNQKLVVTNAFETIKKQFNILENIKLNEITNEEFFVIILAVVLKNFSNFFIEQK